MLIKVMDYKCMERDIFLGTIGRLLYKEVQDLVCLDDPNMINPQRFPPEFRDHEKLSTKFMVYLLGLRVL